MRVFVTGPTGFVGRELIQQLDAAGHDIVGLLLPAESSESLVHGHIVRGDITDPDSLRGLLDGCDAVVHLASAVGYGQRWETCRAVNVHGTEHVVAEAIRAGIRRFVHMSSVSVYGRKTGVALDETAPMLPIGDPYGDTKIEAERIVRRRAAAGELDLTVVRPTVIYGPGDQLFMPKLVENLRSGRARIIGSGQNTVDLVHVADVAAFLVNALQDPRAVGRTCNLNNPDNPTWQELLETVAVALDVQPPRQRLPYPVALGVAGAMELAAKLTGMPPRLTRYSVRVIGRQYRYPVGAAQELGFAPTVSVEDGVRRCVMAL